MTAGQGEPLIGGAITVWMWCVGGRLILATSPLEAERAIARLLPGLAPAERAAAQRLLDELRVPSAAAA
ncbi:MAG: hypothetical protein OEY20_03525 [Gemmatimonadota bacterium]|nr:hypothetical protein [Gemmatimonadota bacterium]MDH4351681.1 hypothetical protein [Gemmatimonadota bacterium]MDH5196307.1 hypothetical protein [Gemmatimonadota bacterium]